MRPCSNGGDNDAGILQDHCLCSVQCGPKRVFLEAELSLRFASAGNSWTPLKRWLELCIFSQLPLLIPLGMAQNVIERRIFSPVTFLCSEFRGFGSICVYQILSEANRGVIVIWQCGMIAGTAGWLRGRSSASGAPFVSAAKQLWLRAAVSVFPEWIHGSGYQREALVLLCEVHLWSEHLSVTAEQPFSDSDKFLDVPDPVYTYGRLAGCPRPPPSTEGPKQETNWGGLRTAVASTLLLSEFWSLEGLEIITLKIFVSLPVRSFPS